jgi:hypothetical protein
MNRQLNHQKTDQANQLVSRVLRPDWANRNRLITLYVTPALYLYMEDLQGEEHCWL